jgi:hypothetical protein
MPELVRVQSREAGLGAAAAQHPQVKILRRRGKLPGTYQGRRDLASSSEQSRPRGPVVLPIFIRQGWPEAMSHLPAPARSAGPARHSTPMLDAVDLHGAHDFRHTFSTWLEDAGIPARVIDELMGHQRSRHGDLDGSSRIGARYRHTTDAMAVRVVEAIQERLTIALREAQDIQANRQGTRRVF